LRGHVQNSVGVDVEGHLDLGHPAGCGRNSGELEFPDGLVVRRELALTLEDVDLNRRLVVVSRREGLALLGRNRCVTRNEHRRYTPQRLDTERQRCDVEQQNVFLLAGKNRALNRSTDGDHFVRIDALVRLFAEELAYGLLNFWNSGR